METCFRNSHVSYPPQSNALFAALPRNSNRDTYPYQPRLSPRADLKAVNAGNPRTFRREAPVPPPDSRWEVLDLVGLSTYRRPADQRWQQR